MKRDTVRIGVVGVGHLGRLHALQLRHVPEAQFVGIYDSDDQRAAAISEEVGVPAFSSIDELISQVDGLSIVTPTVHHFDYARQALSAGRHIFIEKPMTETIAQAESLIELGRRHQCKIQIGHIERFNPAILALEPLKIRPLFIEAHRMANFNPRGTDVAVVLDLMIHDIDLILSFVKSPLKEVYASGVSIISATEDIANCRIVFENGCVANVTASRISAKNMRKMRFFQPDAYISIDFLSGVSEIYHLDDLPLPPEAATLELPLGEIEKGAGKRKISYKRLEKKDVNPLRHELQLFCRAIQADTVPAVSGEDGLRALNAARRILECIDAHTQLVKQQWNL